MSADELTDARFKYDNNKNQYVLKKGTGFRQPQTFSVL